MKSTLLSTILVGMAAVLLPACVGFNQYKGIQPLSPLPPSHIARTHDALGRLKAPTDLPKVESLQPTFSWTAAGSGTTKYDLEVCVGVLDKSALVHGGGPQVYYREGIEGTSHHLEQLLSPGTVYVWSVRTRSGNVAGPWSTYNFQELVLPVNVYVSGENLWWSFITPGPTSNDVSGQDASAGLGRIYFYREKRFVGSAMEPQILLNFETVGNSMNGGYFYVDRAPGDFTVVCAGGRNGPHKIKFTLGPGETKYVQTRFESFHITPMIEDKDTAIKAISECAFMPNISR